MGLLFCALAERWTNETIVSIENCKDFGGVFWIAAGFPHPPETVPLDGREEGEEKGKEGEEKGGQETEMAPLAAFAPLRARPPDNPF